MKPLFALTLANDHIGLLYRDPSGWQPVGEVAFDSATLEEGLGQLRTAALAIAPEGLGTKVVIPNSEILYDRVVAPGPGPALRRAQIAAALEGRTPYALDELVFDWASEDLAGDGEVIAIAVVARETLAEAEAFAAAHGFNPVAFTAIPATDAFPREPWFGVTAAMQALPDDDRPEPDELPLSTRPAIGDPVADSAEIEAEAALPVEPALQPGLEEAPEPTSTPEPEPQPEPVAEPDPAAEDAATAATAAPFAPPPAAAPPADFDPPPAPVAPWSPPVEAAMAADLAPHGYAALEPDNEADTAAAHDPDTRSWPGEPEDESLDTRRAALGASLSAPAPIAAAPIISTPEPDPAAAPSLSIGAWSDDLPDDVPPMPPLRAGDDLRGISPPAVIAAKLPNTSPSEKVRKALAKAPKTLKGKARKPAGRPPEAPPLPASASRPDVPPPASEAEAMTVFGQRRQAVGGKPRYLGLILTLGLLLALAIVAFWAVRLVEPPDDQAAAPAITMPATGSGLAEAPADTAPPPPATSDGPSDEQLAEDFATTPPDEPTDTEIIAETDAGLLDESDLVDPATLTGETDAGGVELVETAPETATATASDERVLPSTSTEEFALSLPDPAITAAPPVQLTHGSMGQPADAAPGAAPVLPAYGTLYQFDADGTIRATPEGVVTPDGVFLVAARPPREPPPNPFAAQTDATPAATGDPPTTGPTAPGSIAALPTTVPQAAPATPAAANSVAPTGDAATAVAAESAFAPDNNVPRQRPRQRPADAILPPGASAPAAVEGALPAPVADDTMPIGLATIRPAARPARIAAAAAAQEQAAATAAAAAAAASTSALALAMAEPAATIRPAARPAALSRRVEPAATAAAVAPRGAPSGHSRSTHQPGYDQDFDDGEPEPARAAPAIPTRAGVAQQATVGRALNLGRLNLIGVFGTANARRALVRESGGRVVSVKVGDRLDGGQVTAIGQNDLSYLKGRQTVRLQLPRS